MKGGTSGHLFDELLPCVRHPGKVCEGEAAAMGEDVPYRRVLLAGCEAGQVVRDRVVEGELAALPENAYGSCGQRLGGREPELQGIARHRCSRAGLAAGGVDYGDTVSRDVELPAVVELGAARFEQFDDSLESVFGEAVRHRVGFESHP
ncbi:MAG: hypothetical protein DYH08_14455 [Actinobacteria bacterium ATB1]|nr:hypothetical protein [Actinobacteria bacterium ATB1]